MNWVQEAAKKIKIRLLLQQKIESILQKMEKELKIELEKNDIDVSHIYIKCGKDDEECLYIIQIQNKYVHFSLDDITKNLSVEYNRPINSENISDDDIYNEIVKIIRCPFIREL